MSAELQHVGYRVSGSNKHYGVEAWALADAVSEARRIGGTACVLEAWERPVPELDPSQPDLFN